MPSLPIHWPEITLSTVLDLVAIFLVALILNRFLRAMSNLMIKHAASQSKSAQLREQQTRTLAGLIYGTGSKVVWVIALLTVMEKVGINPLPALTVAGLASVAIGFGAQNLVRDVITGFYIVFEDQYVIGDTIQVGDTTGRVEHLTLRRTVVRDARGALVTIANGEIRTVSNLSRDWSQALVDGPRILGVQSYDRLASTVRVQVRTAPTRQDEVSRELRRRIQMEFQKQGLPLSSAQRIELAGASPFPQEAHKPAVEN